MAAAKREGDREFFIWLLGNLVHGVHLTAPVAGILLNVSAHTVLSWMRNPTSQGYRPPPLWAIELLVLKMHPGVDCWLAVERMRAQMKEARTSK